mgnify:FL=1
MDKLNFKVVVNAVVHGVLVAVLGFLANATDIYALDWSAILNIAVLAAVGSFVKTLGTNADGTKAFGVRVK